MIETDSTTMDAEIPIALSFFISYLYNKLPRRRVNLFGEELDKAIRQKFIGHWYPEKPFKGSAYRCLRVGDPLDAVIHIAACESGLDVQDIVENLPLELCVWIDPGEVSYRIGEKGVVKILYSKQKSSSPEDGVNGNELREHCFNPDAQCFKPIENISSSMRGLNLGSEGSSPGSVSPPNSTPSPVQQAFMTKSATPLVFTTASFAQTKFGSTKLKNSGKRSGAHRMSPTEFSNYIKQRSMVHQQHHHGAPMFVPGTTSPHNPRSLSPNPQGQQHQGFEPFMFMATTAANQNHLARPQQQQPRRQMFESGYIGDIFSNNFNNNNNSTTTMSSAAGVTSTANQVIQGMPSSQHHPIARPNFLDVSSNVPSLHNSNANSPTTNNNNTLGNMNNNDKGATLLDTFNFGNVYPNHYQHLLMAN